MLKSFKHFAKLCFFSGDPADVDGRTSTLVVLFLILSILIPGLPLLVDWIPHASFSGLVFLVVGPVLGTTIEQLFVALCIYVILHIRRVPQNFRQTVSSYLGVSIIIALFSLVLFGATDMIVSLFHELRAFFDRSAGYSYSNESMFTFYSLVFHVTTAWKILAFGYVLYKSMEVKFWQAGVVAIMVIYAPQVLNFFS